MSTKKSRKSGFVTKNHGDALKKVFCRKQALSHKKAIYGAFYMIMKCVKKNKREAPKDLPLTQPK